MVYKTVEGEKLVLNLYRELLNSWPVEHTILNIKTGYGETHIIKSGSNNKPKLLLLHGTGTNSATWLNDVTTYIKEYQVFAVDIPGEAGLSSMERSPLNREIFNSWLDEVVSGLGISSFYIVGQSLGGWIALSYAISGREKVKAITLISPSGIVEAKTSYFIKFIFYSLLGSWGEKRILKILESDMKLEGRARDFFMLTMKHFIFRMERPEIFSDDELNSLNTPLYYIAGKKDPLLDSQKTARRIRKLVKNSTVEVDESGHLIRDVAKRISDFFFNL